jgi:hypothetical protein
LAEEEPKSTPVSSVKTDAAKLLRQNWTTFVRKICSHRPANFIVKENDAHSVKWANKTLTGMEYFIWRKAYIVYRKEEKNLPNKKGVMEKFNTSEMMALDAEFEKLFPGKHFWSSDVRYKQEKVIDAHLRIL